jgi:hypothetical protein
LGVLLLKYAHLTVLRNILGGMAAAAGLLVATGVKLLLPYRRRPEALLFAPGRHPWAGSVYYWSLAVVFVSMAALAASRWMEDYHLFALGSLSFLAASLGRQARRRRWRNWVPLHIVGMGFSYVLLITAFYVDNGKSLQLWRDLLQIAFWIFPSAIGVPIILGVLRRHSVAR